MAQPRHKAVAAGIALTLAFGATAAPALATAPADHADDASTGEGTLPAPSDFDRTDAYAQGSETLAAAPRDVAVTRAVAGLSDEMKYFSKYESSCNYDQGFSYGDGYNAMGYYQFDRRFKLVPFIESVYKRDPQKYSMFSWVTARGQELMSAPIYDKQAKKLTELGQLANDSWHAAYATDPAEFSALQDAYSYNHYYLPVERLLKKDFKVDISGRADCVKGLAWGMCNLFGEGGVRGYFKAANLSDAMTDRELVAALCDSVIDYYSTGKGKGHQYAAGYVNRYRGEKRVCLEYVSKHEAEQQAQQDTPIVPEGQSGQSSAPDASTPAPPASDSTPEPPSAESNPPASTPQDAPKPPAAPAPGNGTTAPEPPAQTPEPPAAAPQDDVQNNGGASGSSSDSGSKGDASAGNGGGGDKNDAPAGNDGGSNKGDTPAGDSGNGSSGEQKPKVYTVVFDDCDPTRPDPMFQVKAGDAFLAENTLPSDPAHESFSFEGWCHYDRASKAYGEPFDPAAPVSSDLYLAAAWAPKQFGAGVVTPEEPMDSASQAGESDGSDLPKTLDAAGIAAAVAAAMSAAGVGAVAYGHKVRHGAEPRGDE